MKTKNLLIILIGLFSFVSYSQETPSKKVNGITVYDLDVKKLKSQQEQIGEAKLTANKAIYKKIEYPVYISEKGKQFIVYPNKDNTGYNKKYIK